MEDISVLEEQENSVRSDVALGAHLMALNRLRQEIIREHRDNQSLRQRIENVIQHNLARLESIQ
jgi:MoxR-like ATPase